jgi:hypothetical protein
LKIEVDKNISINKDNEMFLQIENLILLRFLARNIFKRGHYTKHPRVVRHFVCRHLVYLPNCVLLQKKVLQLETLFCVPEHMKTIFLSRWNGFRRDVFRRNVVLKMQAKILKSVSSFQIQKSWKYYNSSTPTST